MWLVFIKDSEVFIEEVTKETEDYYVLRPSLTSEGHHRVKKNIVHRTFETKEEAYAVYDELQYQHSRVVYNLHENPTKAELMAFKMLNELDSDELIKDRNGA